MFKFGGLCDSFTYPNEIERYNLKEDFWEIIPFKTNFKEYSPKFFCSSGTIQISAEYILILGGKFIEDEEKWTNQSFLFRVDNQSILYRSGLDLPYKGNFSCLPFIYENTLFCLENLEKNENKKISLACNSKSWTEI